MSAALDTLRNIANADDGVKPLGIDATALPGAQGTFLDPNQDALVLERQNPEGTNTVKVIDLGLGSSFPQAMAPYALAA